MPNLKRGYPLLTVSLFRDTTSGTPGRGRKRWFLLHRPRVRLHDLRQALRCAPHPRQDLHLACHIAPSPGSKEPPFAGYAGAACGFRFRLKFYKERRSDLLPLLKDGQEKKRKLRLGTSTLSGSWFCFGGDSRPCLRSRFLDPVRPPDGVR